MNNKTALIHTVNGTIQADYSGAISTHEHLLLDFRCVFQKPISKDNSKANEKITLHNLGWIRQNWANNLDNLLLDDKLLAINEIKLFEKYGGKTIVDVTPIGLGRNPLILKEISAKTGVNIVMGSSYYIEKVHPNHIKESTIQIIQNDITKEFYHGVGQTKIMPGIIGEIGCSWPWTKEEQKIVHASALAQKETGAPLMIHPGRHNSAPMEILNFLQKLNIQMDKVIMAHIERTIVEEEELKKVAATGCYLEYDLFGHENSFYPLDPKTPMPNDFQRLTQIQKLIDLGHLSQILIAQDICSKHRLTQYGGHGYHHILENIVPRMELMNFTSKTIETITIQNPINILKF